MTSSILRKTEESAALAHQVLEHGEGDLTRCASLLASRFSRGGKLITLGNGGSACDAMHAAVEFQHPIVEKRRALAAMAVPADTALLTAVGNDTDFSQVFADALAVWADERDAVLGISTSGASANVNRGIRAARDLGALTIGFSGRDGGALADLCEVCFVVPSWSVHRIQEVHTLLLHLLWDEVHIALGEDDVL